MQANDYYFDLMDKFIDGSISEVERGELKKAAEQDPTLQAELAKHIKAKANIRIGGEKQLKSQFLASFQEEKTQEAKEPRKLVWRKRWFAIAASMFFALAASYFLLEKQEDTSLQLSQLLADPPSLNMRGENQDAFLNAWNQAELAYQNLSFEQSIELFNSINENYDQAKSHQGKLNIFKGLNYLNLKNYDAALTEFGSVSQQNPLHEEATWYIAVTHYESKNYKMALPLLEAIGSNPNHYRKALANKLISNIPK